MKRFLFALIERIPRCVLRGKKPPFGAFAPPSPEGGRKKTNGISQSPVLAQQEKGERDRGLGGLSRIPRCMRRGSSLFNFRQENRLSFRRVTPVKTGAESGHRNPVLRQTGQNSVLSLQDERVPNAHVFGTCLIAGIIVGATFFTPGTVRIQRRPHPDNIPRAQERKNREVNRLYPPACEERRKPFQLSSPDKREISFP